MPIRDRRKTRSDIFGSNPAKAGSYIGSECAAKRYARMSVLRHFAAYGSRNRYKPLNVSSASGKSGT